MNDKNHFPETLTSKDGKNIKQALLEALSRSQDSEIRKLADEVMSATPWFESGVTLYIGYWRLDRQKARLIRRIPQITEGPIFEADVFNQSGQWIVGEVTVGRLVRPR